jgi:transmembrane serine protease 9
VLTAAHCCEGASSATIHIGDYNKAKEDPGEFSVEAKQIIVHPDYGKHPQSQIANDICLLRTPNLDAKKNDDSVYAAACLPTEDYKHGEACHVSGWGTTSSGGNTSNKMREVGINLMSIAFCNDPTNVANKYVGATFEHLEMCAGTPDGDDDNTLVDAGKDACQGDSGGPLTCVRDDKPVVAGVVSWGFGCAAEGQPGVYANTYYYTDWILATAEQNGFPLTTSTGSTVAPTTGAPTTGGSTAAPTTGGSTHESTTHSSSQATSAASEWEDIVDKIQPGLKCTREQKSEKKGPSKIVGGNVIDEHTYPWQVRLNIEGGLCGGTILSDRWVLTAAHCCEGASSATIHIGDYNMAKEDAGEFSVEAKKIIVHPEYGKHPQSQIANDICLLRTPNLDAKKNDDSVYASACLPTADYNHGEACFVSGWGTTSSGGNTSNKMREVGINLMSIEFCNDPNNVANKMVGATFKNLEMCAGTPDGDDDNTMVDAGKDACQGDSGGPLTCVRDGQPIVAGVVSWGYGCAAEGQPGVYANTYYYTDWIYQTAEAEGFPLL